MAMWEYRETAMRFGNRIVYRALCFGEPMGYRIRLSDREITKRQTAYAPAKVGIPRWRSVTIEEIEAARQID